MEKKNKGDNGKLIKDTDDYQTGWNEGYAAGEIDGMDRQAELAKLAIEAWQDIIPSETHDGAIIQDFWIVLGEIAKNGAVIDTVDEEEHVMDSAEEGVGTIE